MKKLCRTPWNDLIISFFDAQARFLSRSLDITAYKTRAAWFQDSSKKRESDSKSIAQKTAQKAPLLDLFILVVRQNSDPQFLSARQIWHQIYRCWKVEKPQPKRTAGVPSDARSEGFAMAGASSHKAICPGHSGRRITSVLIFQCYRIMTGILSDVFTCRFLVDLKNQQPGSHIQYLAPSQQGKRSNNSHTIEVSLNHLLDKLHLKLPRLDPKFAWRVRLAAQQLPSARRCTRWRTRAGTSQPKNLGGQVPVSCLEAMVSWISIMSTCLVVQHPALVIFNFTSGPWTVRKPCLAGQMCPSFRRRISKDAQNKENQNRWFGRDHQNLFGIKFGRFTLSKAVEEKSFLVN